MWQALDGGLLRLARKKSLKREPRGLEIVERREELKLYHHFEFDRGIQIDHLEDICNSFSLRNVRFFHVYALLSVYSGIIRY